MLNGGAADQHDTPLTYVALLAVSYCGCDRYATISLRCSKIADIDLGFGRQL